MRKPIDNVLRQLEELIRSEQFRDLESDTLEIKPVPADGGSWKERHKSANAFLNTRGGILLLGVKEEGQGADRRYVFKGYHEQAEAKLKDLPGLFTDRRGVPLKLGESFPPPEIRPFMDGRIALVYVDELSAEEKYCFLQGKAYKRILTGDHEITDTEIESQEEFKQESWNARELQPVSSATLDNLDLDKVNEYIQLLNRTIRVETIKADLTSALPFLERKCFYRDGAVTTLGMLVCGHHPGDYLGFRCQMHGYVDMPGVIAQDKQDSSDNVLQLMEDSLAYVLRNIQVGVSAAAGGADKPQYPEELLRETINNALAHRDYSIDRQVIVAIKPGEHLSISNPGSFRRNLLIERRDSPISVLRILPEAKPRNPRLADVLRVYRKWEGRGIGMATLVNLCLQDEIDVPYYRLRQDEVRLVLRSGKLLDTVVENLFVSFNAYIARKLNGSEPTRTQKLVLAYLIKSEWANDQERHTILLTPDNNHYVELRALEQVDLITKHPESLPLYPVYIVDRELVKTNYVPELHEIIGNSFDTLNEISKDCLVAIYCHKRFSRLNALSAKQTARFLWSQQGQREDDIRGFDNFYRKVRNAFNRLTENDMIKKQIGSAGYLINQDYLKEHLL